MKESYFTLTKNEIKRNDNFYSSNIDLIPNEVKFKAKDEFGGKLIVYAIISSYGIATPYKRPVGLAINGYIYTDKYLDKKFALLVQSSKNRSIYSRRTLQALISQEKSSSF